MKSKLQNITTRLFTILCVLGMLVSSSSCSETETTDSTSFAIFYAGITDIGPSMNVNLGAPTYIGGTPSGFTITRVTLNGEACKTNSFVIDEASGAVSVQNTDELATGLYAISVGCFSNGSYHEFKDAITVNMMKPIPDGIAVEPQLITADFAEIIDTESSTELPTAQVTTEGEHISIKKYIIANVYKDGILVAKNDFFEISTTGKISIKRGNSAILPGKYTLDLKLTTAVVDENAEEGIFVNALTIDVTSKPLGLTYTPNAKKVEENYSSSSEAPVLKGSIDEISYALKSVSPACNAISINPTTGIISIAENNSLPIGSKYAISVTATNKYGSADFENVFTFEIVDFIQPIGHFSYDDTQEFYQATAFSHEKKECDGGGIVKYSFVNLDEKLSDLSISEESGKIFAKKGNKIPVGTYTITVLAKNEKNEKEASFKLKVVENPYYFSYIHWGNNINMTPAKSHASQWRITKDQLKDFEIQVAETDIPNGTEVEWSIGTKTIKPNDGEDENDPSVTIDEKGTLKFTGTGWYDNKVVLIIVNATTGKGTSGEVTVKTPVFVHLSGAKNGVTVEYTPFVFQVNPKIGGTSVAPTITGTDAYLSDYRRTFQYYNLNGPSSHKNGQPSTSKDVFMYTLWKSYYDAIGSSSVNAGARAPMSYYDNQPKGLLGVALGYINPDKGHSITINPSKWQDEAGYANGVMIGQITFVTDGISGGLGGSKNQIFPIALWFDTNF